MPLNYTSRPEIESCWSVLGVDTRLADDVSSGEFVNPTEEGYLEDCGFEATDVVNSYVLQRYTADQMNNNRWIRRQTSWIACYLLSIRRGNPAQFVAKYQEALIFLQGVAEGTRPLFDENGTPVPVRSDLAPAHSNLVVDDRYTRRKIRVQDTSSSGGTHGQQDIDHRVPWGY